MNQLQFDMDLGAPKLGKRLRRGWREAEGCWQLIHDDPYLMIVPSLSLVLVMATWGALYLLSSAFVEGFYLQSAAVALVGAYPFNFLSTFLGVAFVALADARIHGRSASVSDGLRVARSKAGPIAKWALLASGVGLILQALQHLKVDWLASSVFSWIAGAAWTILTFFVVPVLAFEDRGIRDTLRRSGRIVRERWGEGLGGATNLATVFTVACLVLGLGGGLAAAVAFSAGTVSGVAVVVALGVVFLCLLQAFLASGQLLALVLYRFATGGETTGVFNAEQLARAFPAKRRRWRPWRR